MANRHIAQKAKGGKVAYDGEKSNVIKAARKKATGGAVELKATGGAATPRLDKRARGGACGGWSGNVWSSAKRGK